MAEQFGDGGLAASRPVWRPRRDPVAPPAADSDRPLRCGGPVTVDERFELMRELKRQRDEQTRLEREAAEAEREREKPEPPTKDEDEQRRLERFRNDRYAVKLLRQVDDVWGGDAGSGVLG